MALINCVECNNQISDMAIACPQCGCPTNKDSWGTASNDLYASSNTENTKSSNSGGCSTVLGGISMIVVGGFICLIAFKVFNFIIGAVGGVLALIGFVLMSIAS